MDMHFAKKPKKSDVPRPDCQQRIVLKDFDVIWSLLGDDAAPIGSNEDLESQAESSVMGSDKSPTKTATSSKTTETNRIDFRFFGVNATYESYSPASPKDSSLSLKIRDFEIVDQVHESRWRKFLGHMKYFKGYPRETGSNMVEVEYSSSRTEFAELQRDVRLAVPLSSLCLSYNFLPG